MFKIFKLTMLSLILCVSLIGSSFAEDEQDMNGPTQEEQETTLNQPASDQNQVDEKKMDDTKKTQEKINVKKAVKDVKNAKNN